MLSSSLGNSVELERLNLKSKFSVQFVLNVFSLSILVLIGVGCSAMLISIDPIDAKRLDSNSSYPPESPDRVVYFSTRTAIPAGLRVIKLASLTCNLRANFSSYESLLKDFQKKTGQLGGNAIVLESITEESFGVSSIYKGKAIAYRLYLDNPAEDIDLKAFPEATQLPPEPKSITTPAYPGITAPK